MPGVATTSIAERQRDGDAVTGLVIGGGCLRRVQCQITHVAALTRFRTTGFSLLSTLTGLIGTSFGIFLRSLDRPTLKKAVLGLNFLVMVAPRFRDVPTGRS